MRQTIRPLLMFGLVLLLAGCQTVGGWFSKEDAELKPAELVDFTPSVQLRQAWSTDVGRGISKSRPSLYPHENDGLIWAADYRGRITAVDAQTGRVRHRFDTDLEISAGPVVQAGLLMVGTFDGELIVFDSGSGAERWRAQLSSEILSQPVLHDGIVIGRSIDGRVFGLDQSDGRRVWVYDRSVPLLTLRGTSDPLVRAGQVFIGYDDGMVAALRVADGIVLWEQRVAEREGRTELDRLADIDGPMAIVGSELYVVSYRGRMASLALDSGRILWVKDIASASGISLQRTLLASADKDDTIWLVDRRNGATEWRDESLARRKVTRPVFFDNYLITQDSDGYLHVYETSSGSFAARVRPTRDSPAAAPLVVGNTIYLLDESGTLSAWRLRGS